MVERFGGVLVNARRQILLAKSDAEFFGDFPWTFVNGPANKDEAPTQAALRIVYEETGYQARIISSLGNYEGNSPDTACYLMEPVGSRPIFKRQKNVTRWLSFEEAASLVAEAKDSNERNYASATLRAVEKAFWTLSDVDRPATCQEDWQTKPMPTRRKRITLDIHYDNKAMARIRKGFLPVEMEDHWFAWFEDPFLYLHRSWTGFCIYQVNFERDAEGWIARYALVNRDLTQYTSMSDDDEVRTLREGIDLLLLRRFDAPSLEATSDVQRFETVTNKVGPMPTMPPLPPTPYPYKRPYVFTDGTVEFADGFLQAMRLNIFEHAGLARKVPFGVGFKTDEEKLWLLGRTTFAPHFIHDVNKITHPDADIDDNLSAETVAPPPDAKIEVILELGSELGTVELIGARTRLGWLFRTLSIDQSAGLLGEAEGEGPPLLGKTDSRQESNWVGSWAAALHLLDRYRWDRLHPVAVHPDFQQRVWLAVRERLERDRLAVMSENFEYDLRRWRELCAVPTSSPQAEGRIAD